MNYALVFFPKPTFKTNSKINGSTIVITDRKQNITKIFATTPYEQKTCLTPYGARLRVHSDAPMMIDLLDFFEREKISLSLMQQAKRCIFIGEMKDGIFVTDITMMYLGALPGQEARE
ncbi:MAG: hypothetical protein RR540_00890 [Oscillospiraceae bacterium]